MVYMCHVVEKGKQLNKNRHQKQPVFDTKLVFQ